MREGFGILLRVLYPVTPHIAHELWHALGYAQRQGELLDAPWPKVDEAGAEAGRDRAGAADQRQAPRLGAGAGQRPASHEIEKLAVASEAFAKHAGGATPKKVIVVPGRLVNVVI